MKLDQEDEPSFLPSSEENSDDQEMRDLIHNPPIHNAQEDQPLSQDDAEMKSGSRSSAALSVKTRGRQKILPQWSRIIDFDEIEDYEAEGFDIQQDIEDMEEDSVPQQ